MIVFQTETIAKEKSMKDVYITAAATLIASLPAPADGHGGASLPKMAEFVVTLANELSHRFEVIEATLPDQDL
jgi:hypothetical protein